MHPHSCLPGCYPRSPDRGAPTSGTLFALLLCFAGALATRAAEPGASDAPPLQQRDRIEASFHFSYSDHHFQTHGPGTTTTFRSTRSGTVSGTLERYYAYFGVDSFSLEGSAEGSLSVSDSIVSAGGGGAVSQRESGSGGPVDCRIAVDIDTTRGVYSFTIDLATDTEVVLEGPMRPPERESNVAGFSYDSPDFPLPEQAQFLSGEVEVSVELGDAALGSNLVPLGLALKQMDGGQARPVMLQWQLGLPPPKPELELLLSVEGYSDWLPEGPLPGSPAGTPGNQATLVATLRRKDGGALERGAAVVRFFVEECSAEPGYCLNYPLTPGPDHEKPDLRLVSGGDADPVDSEGQQAMTAAGDWRVAKAQVGAFDWGAFGSIKAEARVPGYEPIVSIVAATGEESLRLPKRADGSAIGEAWLSRYEVSDQPDDDDSESSPGNGHDGDGYTLYEEYRGLIARGQHSRRSDEALLDPKRKDLVVLYSEEGDSLSFGSATLALLPTRQRRESELKAGLKLFETAAGRVHAIAMDQSEAPKSREINVNSSTVKRGSQHGVLIYDVGSYRAAGGAALEATGAYPLELTGKTPRTTEFVAIEFAGMIESYPLQVDALAKSGAAMPYTLDLELANTVAHELAHACSVGHHGNKETDGPTRFLGKGQLAPSYTVIGADGKEVTQRPFQIVGRVAGEESQSCGDQSCLMVYPNFYQWRLYAERGRGYTWQALLPFPMGTTLCAGSDGVPPNAVFGPAAPRQGNCKAQLRIRDY